MTDDHESPHCPWCMKRNMTRIGPIEELTTTIGVAQPPYEIKKTIGWVAMYHCNNCGKDERRDVPLWEHPPR